MSGAAQLSLPNTTWSRCVRWSLGAGIWGAALAAVMSFSNADTGHGEMFCGPWGCTAPLEAVLACHAGWLLLLGPLDWFLVRTRGWLSWRAVAALSFLGSVVGAGWIAAIQLAAVDWNLSAMYLWHRIGLDLLQSVDFPIVPLTVTAAITAAVSWLSD